MKRQQTSSINIRNFIGTESRRTSRPLSVISMLPRADAGGLQASTVTYFVLSVSCAIQDHSCSEVSDAPRLARRAGRSPPLQCLSLAERPGGAHHFVGADAGRHSCLWQSECDGAAAGYSQRADCV